MKKISIILLFLLLPMLLWADVIPSFDGYLYELPSIASIPSLYSELPGYEIEDDYMWSNTTRLRLRPELLVGDNGRLTLHYEVNMNAAKYLFQKPSGDITNRQAVDLNWMIDEGGKYNIKHYINHYIDRLYYKQMFSFGEVIVGRQNISYGVGRIWQPTDKFNPLNPANFSKFEKDGADAVRAKIYLGNFSDLDVVYNFRDKWNKGNYAARLRTNWKEYDMSIMGGWFDDDFVVGGDFAGNFFGGVGVRGEILYSNNKWIKDASYISGILGADYQFSAKFYGLIEYHYNGQGTSCKLCYSHLFDKLYKGDIQNVGTNYIALQGTYLIHPLVGLSLMDMTNIIDGSGFITASAKYSALEWLDVSLAGMLCYGASMTEYSYYSSAIYMMIQCYF